MKNFLKSILIWSLRILLLLTILIICSYKIATSTKIVPKIITKTINQQSKDLQINNLKIGTIIFAPDNYILKNLSFEVSSQGQKFNITTKTALIHNILAPTFEISINELTIKNSQMSFENINLNGQYDPYKTKTFKGMAKIQTIEIQKYMFNRMLTFVNYSPESIDLSPVYVRSNNKYKGTMQGSIKIQTPPHTFPKLKAVLVSSKGDMDSDVIRYLMGDINNNLSFLPFQKQLNDKKFIRLEKFHVTVHNKSSENLEAEINLDSSELNLKLNPTITINLR
ncbi:MAG: hypothetical protein HQL25_04435 [Candidatus Omnitrophica bacterium]|nr:hypothetical protein [Candidatus Omnitrophota bacterium]